MAHYVAQEACSDVVEAVMSGVVIDVGCWLGMSGGESSTVFYLDLVAC
jgi:hypothetical protein